MNNVHQEYSQGGDFVISPISKLDIFTREDFSEEHKEIYNMVMDFDKDKVLTQKKEIESYNPKLSKKLLDEMAELGLLGIDIPGNSGVPILIKLLLQSLLKRLFIAHLLPLHGRYKPALVLCH